MSFLSGQVLNTLIERGMRAYPCRRLEVTIVAYREGSETFGALPTCRRVVRLRPRHRPSSCRAMTGRVPVRAKRKSRPTEPTIFVAPQSAMPGSAQRYAHPDGHTFSRNNRYVLYLLRYCANCTATSATWLSCRKQHVRLWHVKEDRVSWGGFLLFDVEQTMRNPIDPLCAQWADSFLRPTLATRDRTRVGEVRLELLRRFGKGFLSAL
jgi:hypothetical protein